MTATKGLVVLCLALAIVKCKPALENQSKDIEEQNFQVDYQLPNDIKPIHYEIELVPHLEHENDTVYDGKVTILFRILKATSELILHSKNLTINETATVLRINATNVVIPTKHSYDIQKDLLILSFDNILLPAKMHEWRILTIEYQGSLRNSVRSGFYKSYFVDDENKKHWYAATHFVKDSARLAFPCWDDPAIRTTFRISVKHNPNLEVLTNSKLSHMSEIDPNDGRIWKHFDTTKDISIYNIAVVVGEFEQYSNEDGSINMWVRKGYNHPERVEEAMKLISRVDKEFQSVFKDIIEPPKINLVVIPYYIGNYYFGPSSQLHLLLYRETMILPDTGKYGLYGKLWPLQVIANGLAQQWYGNFFSLDSWNYEWLHHALPKYFENYAVEKILTEWGWLNAIQSYRMSSNLQGDSYGNWPAIEPTDYKEGSLYDRMILLKMPSILNMIWDTISKEVYQERLLRLLRPYHVSNITPDQFWDELQEALDDSGVPFGNFDVKEFANCWIKQKRYPEITVRRSYESGDTVKLHITQQFYRRKVFYEDPVDEGSEEFTEMEKEDKQLWTVPISITSRLKQNFTSTIPTIWITQRNTTVYTNDILPSDWLIINLKRTGYYRVNYDNDNWLKIAKYMNSEDYVNIDVNNRVQLMDDAFDMFIRDKIEPAIFFELFNYLGRESSYIVWKNVFDNFYSLGDLINIPNWAKIIKPYIAILVNNLVNEIGYEEQPNENTLLSFERWRILGAACKFGHPKCEVIAQQQLIEFLRNTEIDSVDSLDDKERWILSCGLRKADQIIWSKVYDLYLKNPESSFLDFLSLSEDPNIIEDYLRMMISLDSAIVKNNQTVVAFSNLCYIRNINSDVILNFVERHMKELLLYFSNPHDILGPLVKIVYRIDQLRKLEQILEAANIEDTLKQIYKREKFLISAQTLYTRMPDWMKFGKFEDPEDSNVIL